MQSFSSDKRLQEICFKISHPPSPPQELNSRPLRNNLFPCYQVVHGMFFICGRGLYGMGMLTLDFLKWTLK